MNDSKRQIEVQAAYALLMAAILNRDLVGAMPPAAYQRMPGDIKRRLNSHIYQEAFDALPEDVRVAAEALTLADPDVAEARSIDAEARA
jgi:hypothetical protein